jgi:GTP-binding protein
MIITSAEFVISAAGPAQYPPAELPEVAFAGRSNVGKSSLINTLVNRRRLVKTSSTPGRTQLLNFFQINAACHFVDLPGFGYARAPAHIRKKWGPMIAHYLANRTTLKTVVLIMDVRRTPGHEEQQLIDWLNGCGLSPVLVLTKIDKLSKARRISQRRIAAQALGRAPEEITLFSSKTREGLGDLWRILDRYIEAAT